MGVEGVEGVVGGRDGGEVGVTEGRGEKTEGRGETWERMKQRAESEGGKPVDDPWKRSRGGPSEEWQPEEWQPKGKKSP